MPVNYDLSDVPMAVGGEDLVALDMLCLTARTMRLDRVAPENLGEWVWREAFLSLARDQSRGDYGRASKSARRTCQTLTRFMGITFPGLTVQTRDEWVLAVMRSTTSLLEDDAADIVSEVMGVAAK